MIARILATIVFAVSIGTAHAASVTEKLSIVSNSDIVGTLVATTEGNRVTVDYRIDNNGRGPKHREEIVTGPASIPVSWSVRGTSMMGGAVEERYSWADGRATWSSQADNGTAAATAPPLYIVNDDSPWAQGIYARAALGRPDSSIPILPGGRLTISKVRDLTIGRGKAATPVTTYRLTGIQLYPVYVILDRQRRLFATYGSEGEIAVRAGYESEVATIRALGTEIEAERAAELQKTLAHKFDAPVRIRNVRIFDPASGKLLPLSSVVVMRNTITQIITSDSAATPADEVVIEGDGGTLYPGLHDMHSHATLRSGLLYLAAGVTATRDMGNDNGFMLGLLPRIERGDVAWPRIVPAGFLEGRSPYSAHNGFIPETLDEALRYVRWYADRGYYEIKIYNSMNPDWVKPIAAEAHRLGLKVTGHVPAFSSPDRVIADGYDAIAHINQLMLGWILDPKEDTRTPVRITAMSRAGGIDLMSERVQRTVDAMKARGVALDTTAFILEQLMLSRAGKVPAGREWYFSHMPIAFQRYQKRSFVTVKDDAEDQAYRAGFAKILETIGMLHKKGIRLLPGTDDGVGLTAQREIELYVQAGLTPVEALRSATLGSEEYLGRTDRLGTIAQGKLADMVLVAGDPTKDISAIRRPKMVMKDGMVYFPSEIYTALGIEPFAQPPTVREATVKLASKRADTSVGFGYDDSIHED